KALASLEVGNVRLAGHAGREDELLWPQHHLFTVAVDDDGPFLRRLVPFRRPRGGARPVVQLHDLRVEFQPVADLVLRRENRPVLRKVDIGQVIVPDGIMQAERLVALAPAVARTLVLLENDRRHAELAQPGAKRDTTLPAANDDRVGLLLVAERARFLLALFLPGLGTDILAMPGTERPRETCLLLMALQLGERR